MNNNEMIWCKCDFCKKEIKYECQSNSIKIHRRKRERQTSVEICDYCYENFLLTVPITIPKGNNGKFSQ